jgi:glycosyltransferase involved in cell wall biosynthesis
MGQPLVRGLKYCDSDTSTAPRVKTRKKRILLVSLGYDFGGVEVYILNLVKLLDGKVEFFALCFEPELVKNLRDASVRVIELPHIPRSFKTLTFLIAALILAPVVLLYEIDTVQINGYAESLLLLPARVVGCKAICTRHLTLDIAGRHWYDSPGSWLARLTYKICARFANCIVCVSDVVAKQIRRLVPASRVVVIPNWLSHIHSVEFGERTSPATKRILFVGRLSKHKGLHLLLEALSGIEGIELTVVGDGACRSEYELQAASMNVRFAGFQRTPETFFAAADIFVMPSLGPEGLPLVCLEAMAHHLPCLFSDLPVHKEITNDGEAAMLFTTGDFKSLRQQLIQMLDNEELCRRYADSAYRTVQARFSPAAAEQAYVQVFEI